MARKTMARWISEARNSLARDTPCSHISLVLMTGLSEQEITTIKFPGKAEWTDPKLEEFFKDAAETHVQDAHGMHTFNLIAHYGSMEPPMRFPFAINSQVDMKGATEAPTETGGRMQMMRHTETIFQSMMRRQAQLDEYTARITGQLIEQNSRLMHDNAEAFTVVKELLQKDVELGWDKQMKMMEFQRSSEERKKWIALLPAIANTVLGREVFPQGTADSAILDAAAEHLGAEDMQMLATKLPPELMGIMADMLTKRLEKKKREKEAAEANARLLAEGALEEADDNDGEGGKGVH